MPEDLKTDDLDRLVIEFVESVHVAAETKGYTAGRAATMALTALCLGYIPDSTLVEFVTAERASQAPRRIIPFFDKRRIAPVATAAIILVSLMAIGGNVQSDKGNLKRRGSDNSGQFQAVSTGDIVNAPGSTIETANRVHEIAYGGVVKIDSIERWEVDGCWSWTVSYYNEDDGSWVGTSPASEENNISDEFTEFMVSHSRDVYTAIKAGHGQNIGHEERVIDGARFAFTKYAIIIDGLPPVILWDGVPVSR